MNKSIFRFIQCMIVLGLATYLAEKWISGRLSFYINMRFAIFTLIGILGLALMVIISLYPLFTPEQRSDNPVKAAQFGKLKTNWVFLFLLPIAAAVSGLSALIIVAAYFSVFMVGLIRLQQIHSTEPDGQQHQLAEISGATLIFLTIPLIFGVLVPVRPLSTSSLSTRGMALSAPVSIGQQAFKTMEIAPDDRTVLDWIKIFNYEKDLSAYLGKSANVTGFVYYDPRLKNGQFMVGRFTMTCCVADAFAIGMVVDWPENANLTENSWVNVKGTVDVVTIDGQKVPVIHAQVVKTIQAPEQPYLYP